MKGTGRPSLGFSFFLNLRSGVKKRLNHAEPLVHTTGPHPDTSVSAVMSGWKIKMARGEWEEEEGREGRGDEERERGGKRCKGDRLGRRIERDRDRRG